MSNTEEKESKCECKDGECKCECDCKEGKCECKECGCKGDCNCNCNCKDEKCECEDCKCECHNGECEECKECKDCEDCKCEECKPDDLQNELIQERGERLALLAEFVNYKKRAEADKGDFIVYANSTLLKQIIEIADDFDRALKGIKTSEKELISGVQMIHKKISDLISSYGLQSVEIKEGDNFSPEKMEAVTTVEVKDGKMANKVIEVLQKGYVNKQTGKTFKHAVVVIGKKS